MTPRFPGKSVEAGGRRTLLVMSLAMIALGGAWHSRSAADDDDRADREHPIVTAPRVSHDNGKSAVHLDTAASARAGIRTRRLRRVALKQSIQAMASVPDLQPLVQLVANVRTAEAQLDSARAQREAAAAQAARARTLFEDDQNISAAQLQAVEAAGVAAQSALRSAQAQYDASIAAIRLAWGEYFATAAADRSANHQVLDDLLEHRSALVQLVVPPGPALDHVPSSGVVLTDGGHPLPLEWIGAAVRAEAHVAGRSHYYLTRADASLATGATAMAQLHTGARTSGVSVPLAARVWWQGRMWIFVRNAAGDFERRELPVDADVEDGAIRADLEDGVDVVIQGAQVLLSEELRAENFSTDVGGR